MSRRKQSRPRHVDNEGISLGVEVNVLNPKDFGLRKGDTGDSNDDPMTPQRKRSSNDIDNDEDDKSTEMDNTDEFCPSDEAPSPDRCDNISACEKCGVCFTDLSQFIAHKKLCGNRNRILMPYDPPVNGYIQNGYDFGRNSLDLSMGKDFSDGEYRDDKDDFESMDEEDRSRNDNADYEDSDEMRGKSRKRLLNEEDVDNEDENRYHSQTRSDESLVVGLQDVLPNVVPSFRDRRGDVEVPLKNERCNDLDRNEENKDTRRKLHKTSDIESERVLFGRHNNVTLEPLAATNAAVAQCSDGIGSREPVPEEVSMFRTMLFQLQQQQMMQIQMIQQMRRQLISSGVNPSLLPADIDLNMMSSEGLASVGAAMSGLQSATALVAGSRDLGNTSSSGYNASRSPSHDERSRDSSPSQSESPRRESDRPSSPIITKSSDRDLDRLREGARKIKDEKKPSVMDLAERYLSPTTQAPDSLYCKDHTLQPSLTRNPLEILQEKTAASLSSLPLPLGLRSSSSMDSKPYSSSSSLLNSSALFASSPSISALQKETDALKPSPILPPLSIPMSAEDYKGYIQRGTILERSQYASDDPFFKHKCRFCHKVFGSDSALQIHVRSHTGERPFKCNICGNRFSTKGNLKVHFERHKAKYPHIKMDATPVPEHLDRQPNLMPSFAPTPIPPSIPLPPPMSRLPMPPVHHHGPPSSPNQHTHPHSSPFHHGFGGPFLSSIGPGMSPFGLMPPPRDNTMPFSIPMSLSLSSSMSMPIPLGRDSFARRESPTKLSTGSVETSVIRSPRKESPISSNRDASPTDMRRPGIHHPHHGHSFHHFHSPHFELHQRHNSRILDSLKSEDNAESREEPEREHEETESRRSRSRHESTDSRSPSPLARKSLTKSITLPTSLPSSPPPPLSRPSSSHSPRQSPASVISWASLSSSQPPMLPSHHPALFPHPHLPPGFPGLSLHMPGNPVSFPLPPPLSTVLTMSGPRLSSHPPFLPPPPPPPQLPSHISPPPGDGSVFRNSILPTKTIDPSENLEQYMEVQKSETSKLEALVKNIEQKITDPNQCVICHRVLSCKSALQMHYRIHTGERPFKCKICGRSFTTKGNLKTHMGVHRAKPALRMMHQCPVCHKQFTNVLVLQQHIRAHTGSMQHLPHMPLLPSHMDWAHRPPFGLNRHHPYLPPLHHDSHSLDLSGIPTFASSHHLHRERLHSLSTDHNKDIPHEKEKDRKLDHTTDKIQEKHSDDEFSKDGDLSRPHSRNSEDSDDKTQNESNSTEQAREGSSHGNLPFTKTEFESAFLPPAFGNTPFDAPLAALEERVKAIDSQLSQTSFEKFRNSMGLDSAFFPNSSTITNGERSSEFGSESASKPESPASGGDIPSYGFSMLGGFDRNTTTCNICLRTFACKSALDIHYRSHTKLKPFECDVCDRSFSTRGNLKQHLLTHKIRDIPSSAFDDVNEDHIDEEDITGKDANEDDDDDDINELPNEDYPFEEDGSIDDGNDDDLDDDMDQDDDIDDMNDEPSHSEEILSPAKSQDDFQEDNNNISNFQNHNGEEHHESFAEESAGTDNGSTGSTHNKSDGQNSSVDRTSSHPPPTQTQQPSKPNTSAIESTSIPSTQGQRSQNGGSSSSSSNNSNGISTASRRPSGPKHQCMTCMKPFSSASALQIHTRTHTGDKPFKCNVCSKAFTTRGNLKVHMGTHMWNNSPSRRGRRMSIETPFLLSHMKETPFMPPGFSPRPPLDFFYQYPLPMMNGPDSKMTDISVIQNLAGTIPSLPLIPPHLMQGFLPKEGLKLNTDCRTTSESREPRDHSDKKISSGELDLTVRVSSIKDASPSRSSSSTPSSSLPLSVHLASSTVSVTASSTPSPSNNKENSSTAALDLRNMRPPPWLWGGVPCHHCGQIFPIPDALEHHLRTHHLVKTESPTHALSKPEPHPPPAAKALLA